MCIATIAYGTSRRFPLIFAANRDELHSRPTAAASWWPDEPAVLGGRDLVAGGSWLAMNRAGRLAAVTNLPAPSATVAARSRGALVREFLTGDQPAELFFRELAGRASEYAPFNLLGFDGERLYYFGSGAAHARDLGAGVHALSNAPYGASWPKLAAAREGMLETLGMENPAPALLSLLAQGADERPPADSADAPWRQSRLFIRDRTHGTRSSTVIAVTEQGRVRFMERGFDADGRLSSAREHEFALEPPRLRAGA
jgi:uncharacterized protein with NRDE domain